MSANPSYRGKYHRKAVMLPVKGFLNRRFKWLFAYFLSIQKVGAESGAAHVPGRRADERLVPPRRADLTPLFQKRTIHNEKNVL